MRRTIGWLASLAFLLAAPAVASLALLPAAPAGAAGLDVGKPFLCAATEAIECGPDGSCARGTASDVGFPDFIEVEVGRKVIRERDGERKTAIRSQQRVEGHLILQSIQEGLAWSLTVDEASGAMSVSSSGDEVGFLVFGACTRL